nr:HAD family hydrolase [uncultured Sellimonas sp.]
MANIIAVVWDFDRTLVDGYMQDPIFEYYGVDSCKFWKEVNRLPDKYMEEQGVLVNPDTIYLNQFIHYAKEGKFKGLTNEKLKEFGKKLKFYPGVPEIFEKTKALIEDDPAYQAYDIKVEHYIVSTGMTQIIKGSSIMPYVEHVWGCELIEGKDNEGDPCISEIAYTIDNTSKTRALFEINKGVHSKDGREGVKVNTKIPEELRRVHFVNMIYIADGPSDIPAFSLLNKNNGATFAIYPKGNKKAMRQVEQMRMDGRINMYAEADFREETTAYMWICNKITAFADRIRQEEKNKIAKYAAVETPRHLTEERGE